uniref:Uncharacterized protein n=1 Tax=Mustela putorius furo TaxID=9669 RepID=M3YE52_MUSPF
RAGGTRPVRSLEPAAGPSNLLALGSGGAEGRRCLVNGLRRIVRVAKGGRVPLQSQTTTRVHASRSRGRGRHREISRRLHASGHVMSCPVEKPT